MRKLKVEWHAQAGCVDGGGYAVVKANGHLLLVAAEKGRNERVKEQLRALCDCWNLWAPVHCPKLLERNAA